MLELEQKKAVLEAFKDKLNKLDNDAILKKFDFVKLAEAETIIAKELAIILSE